MEGKRVITSLRLENILSFGSDAQDIELQPLNVLIGPNASGKSNFIEAFRILNATPEDVGQPIREGGSIGEYLWKGGIKINKFSIRITVTAPNKNHELFYGVTIIDDRSWVKIFFESISYLQGEEGINDLYETIGNGRAEIYSRQTPSSDNASSITKYLPSNISIDQSKSILSQYKNPEAFPEISHLQDIFSSIHFYTGWNLGRHGALRYPQNANLPSANLLEDGSNLGLVLINKPASVRHQITERLKAVLPTVEEIFPKVEGGAVPLYIREKGLSTPISAARLSEGTLRYLCLLTILLDPTPPPIICLEEPEVGLHPHVIPQIAELLIEASQRTQLIVTTHSDALISGLSEHPEAIIICERDDEGTKLRRLEAEQIKPWLDRYAIGDLWRMGEIGGVR